MALVFVLLYHIQKNRVSAYTSATYSQVYRTVSAVPPRVKGGEVGTPATLPEGLGVLSSFVTTQLCA